MRTPAFGAIALMLAACSSASPSATIAARFDAGGAVDLSTAVRGPWTRVCVVGPYADPSAEGRRHAFRWPATAQPTITSSDAVSLLVFAQGGRVTTWLEHPRRAGDFSNLSGRCFPRARAGFRRETRPAQGWPGLFPQPGS